MIENTYRFKYVSIFLSVHLVNYNLSLFPIHLNILYYLNILYMGREELFADKGDNKMDDDAVEIKIKFKRSWLIHIMYIIIISVLVVLFFYNPFGSLACNEETTGLTSAPVVSDVEEEIPELDVEVEPEPEVISEPDPDSESELSGEVTLSIDAIKLDVNKTKVESITLKIDNQKKIFTPLLHIYWYDKDSPDSMKEFPNGGKITFTGPIPVGRVSVKKLDNELKARYLRTDDEKKELFKVELYDGTVLLDTETKTITTT